MRTLVRTAITGDATLATEGVTAANVLAGDVDSFEGRPFLNLKWGVENPGIALAATQTTLTIWVHDDGNDYSRIDRIIRRLRVLLTGIEGQVDEASGDRVSQVAWTGDSSDLSDTGHRTIVRQTSYTLNGSIV